MKKFLAVMLSLIFCFSLFAGCAEKETAENLNEQYVAKIGDYQVSQAFFNLIMYAQSMQNEKEAAIKTSKDQISMFMTAASFARERYGITEESVKELVEQDMEEITTSYGDQASFESFLEKANSTEEAMRLYVEMIEIYTLLNEKISAEGEECYVSEEEVKNAFNVNYGDKLKVQHILVATQGDANTPARSDDEAKAIVDEILGKLASGEEFPKLIEEYDEDPGMTSANYYTFGSGEMVPEFEEASRNLKVGEYTKEAVKSSYGYHIIKRYPLDENSNEYTQTRMGLSEEKLLVILQGEIEKQEIKWSDTSINKYADKFYE